MIRLKCLSIVWWSDQGLSLLWILRWSILNGLIITRLAIVWCKAALFIIRGCLILLCCRLLWSSCVLGILFAGFTALFRRFWRNCIRRPLRLCSCWLHGPASTSPSSSTWCLLISTFTSCLRLEWDWRCLRSSGYVF